jgi:ABC-type transporter Mla MlaB component
VRPGGEVDVAALAVLVEAMALGKVEGRAVDPL